MRRTKRSRRRHQTTVKHRKRVEWMRREWGRIQDVVKETPTLCSGYCCGNRRKYEGPTQREIFKEMELRESLSDLAEEGRTS